MAVSQTSRGAGALTTNIGAESIRASALALWSRTTAARPWDAMKKAFSPEFRNRLVGVIQFKALPTTVIENVVDKFLTELQALTG